MPAPSPAVLHHTPFGLLRDPSLSVMSSRSQEGWQQITGKPRAEDKKPRQKKPEAVSVPATAGNSNRSIFAELDRCGILQSPTKPESRRNAIYNLSITHNVLQLGAAGGARLTACKPARAYSIEGRCGSTPRHIEAHKGQPEGRQSQSCSSQAQASTGQQADCSSSSQQKRA